MFRDHLHDLLLHPQNRQALSARSDAGGQVGSGKLRGRGWMRWRRAGHRPRPTALDLRSIHAPRDTRT